MLMYKLLTKNYKHYYSFDFQGKAYLVHSIVRLTDEGQKYLGSSTKEVILTENFIDNNGRRNWKYEFRSIQLPSHITNASTDRPPNKLIEEVIVPASEAYVSREIFGVDSPHFQTGTKHTKSDWEIPEVRMGWIIFIAVFLGVAIFKDWYVQAIIRIVATLFFFTYRSQYKNAYTTYTHDEDIEILKKKYEILYGIKSTKENENYE